jgi:hypothetical protein
MRCKSKKIIKNEKEERKKDSMKRKRTNKENGGREMFKCLNETE